MAKEYRVRLAFIPPGVNGWVIARNGCLGKEKEALKIPEGEIVEFMRRLKSEFALADRESFIALPVGLGSLEKEGCCT